MNVGDICSLVATFSIIAGIIMGIQDSIRETDGYDIICKRRSWIAFGIALLAGIISTIIYA